MKLVYRRNLHSQIMATKDGLRSTNETSLQAETIQKRLPLPALSVKMGGDTKTSNLIFMHSSGKFFIIILLFHPCLYFVCKHKKSGAKMKRKHLRLRQPHSATFLGHIRASISLFFFIRCKKKQRQEIEYLIFNVYTAVCDVSAKVFLFASLTPPSQRQAKSIKITRWGGGVF